MRDDVQTMASARPRVDPGEYALGPARESRDWYYQGCFILGKEVTQHRLSLLSSSIRLLLTIIPEQRDTKIRKPNATYTKADEMNVNPVLLRNVPLP